MNNRNNPKYLFGKVGLSKKTYIKTNIGLRMKEKSIDEDFDILSDKKRFSNNNISSLLKKDSQTINDNSPLSLRRTISSRKFLTMKNYTDSMFIKKIQEITSRKSNMKISFPQTVVNKSSISSRKPKIQYLSPKQSTVIKNSIDMKNKSASSIKMKSIVRMEKDILKKPKISTKNMLQTFYIKKKVDRFKRKSKEDINRSVKRHRAHTPNPLTTKLKIKSLLSVQKKTNELKEIIKRDMIKEQKFKRKNSKLFVSSEEKDNKVKQFIELKKDIGLNKKISKNNFMNRLIKFNNFDNRNKLFKSMHVDIAYSQRNILCKTFGFSWKEIKSQCLC